MHIFYPLLTTFFTFILATAYGVSFPLENRELENPETLFSSSYRLKVGDKLNLSLYGDELSKRDITVDPMGEISYLFLNGYKVLGKTIDEVRKELTEKLKTYFKDPLLTITATEFSGEFYNVIGEVNNPGKKKIKGNPTILTALAEAGGFTNETFRNIPTDQADLKRSFLARKGTYVPVDLESLVRKGDTSQDLPIEAEDYLFIATITPSQVFVLGEVYAPSTIDFLNPLTLMQAIAEVGGVTSIASSRIAVIRGSLSCPVQYFIDFNQIKKGKACDFLLESGDIVYVPAMQFTNLKEIIQVAIATFVGTVASIAGSNAYIKVNPQASGTTIVQPVPVINFGAGAGNVAAPTPPLPPTVPQAG